MKIFLIIKHRVLYNDISNITLLLQN